MDHRFKPEAEQKIGPMEDVSLTIDQRVALLEARLSQMEIGADSRYDES